MQFQEVSTSVHISDDQRQLWGSQRSRGVADDDSKSTRRCIYFELFADRASTKCDNSNTFGGTSESRTKSPAQSPDIIPRHNLPDTTPTIFNPPNIIHYLFHVITSLSVRPPARLFIDRKLAPIPEPVRPSALPSANLSVRLSVTSPAHQPIHTLHLTSERQPAIASPPAYQRRRPSVYPPICQPILPFVRTSAASPLARLFIHPAR